MGPLGRRPQRQVFAPSVPGRGNPPRFERHAGVALDVEPPFDDPVRRGECGVRVADDDLEGPGQVVAQIWLQQRRTEFNRGSGVRHGLERLVVDDHRGHAILGAGATLRDHGGDWFADVANAAIRQDRLAALTQRRVDDRGVDAPGSQIETGERADDARHARGRLQVDRRQARVRVLAAHKRHLELPRKIEVFDEAGLSAQQARILEPPHRGTDKRHQLECS